MASSTSKLGIPYPNSGDKVSDYPGVAKQLAELLETLMAPAWTSIGNGTAAARLEGRRISFHGELNGSFPTGRTVVSGATLPANLRPARTCVVLASGHTSSAAPEHGRPVGLRLSKEDGTIEVVNAFQTTIENVHLEGVTVEVD